MSAISNHRRVLYPFVAAAPAIPVQSVIAFTSASFFGLISWPVATTANNLLVLGVSVYGGATINTPTGWTKVGEVANGTAARTAIYYIENAASRSGTETVSFSAISDHHVCIAEYSGIVTSGALDKSATNAGSTGGSDSGTTATTAQAHELLFAMFGYSDGPSAYTSVGSPTNGFTIERTELNVSGSHNYAAAFADKIVTGTLTANTGVTANQAEPWAAMIATFKF